MHKAGGPSLECFKTEGERVLPWRHAITCINQGFALCKCISCFVVFHLEVPVCRSFDVFGAMIITIIGLRLHIRAHNSLKYINEILMSCE